MSPAANIGAVPRTVKRRRRPYGAVGGAHLGYLVSLHQRDTARTPR